MDAATDRYSTPSPYKISQWLNVSPDTPHSNSNSAPLLHYDYDALNTATNLDDTTLFSSHTPTSLAWLYGPTMPINHLHDQDSPLLGGLKTPATIPLSSPVSLSRNNTAFYTYTPFQDQDALADFPDWTVTIDSSSHVSPVIRDSFLKHLQSVAPNANNDSTPGPGPSTASVSLPLPLPLPLFDIKNLTPARNLTPPTADFALSPLTPLTPLSPSLSPPSTPTPTARSNPNPKPQQKHKALYAPANHNHNHKKRKHQVIDSPTPLPKALRRRTTASELITPPSSQQQPQPQQPQPQQPQQPQKQPSSQQQHQQQQQQPQQPQQHQPSSSTSSSTSTSRTRTFTHRTFPPTIPISPDLPLLYRQFHASSFYQLQNGVLLGPSPPPPHRPPPGTYNPPRTPLDLYTPRYTTGKGPSKNGLCPICIEPPERGGEGRQVWLAMKFSAFKCYHMQYGHGISASTALPFSPPTAFRHTTRPNANVGGKRPHANVGKHEKTVIREGKCHKCRKWVAVEGVKDLEVKVKELFWWKHAAACHQGSTVEGETGVHVEDDVYRRLVALDEGEAEAEAEGEGGGWGV